MFGFVEFFCLGALFYCVNVDIECQDISTPADIEWYYIIY